MTFCHIIDKNIGSKEKTYVYLQSKGVTMANWLTLHFNIFNDSLKKGLAKGENSVSIELILDGYTVQVVDSTTKIKVPDGEHEFRCAFHFTDSGDTESYRTKGIMFDASEEDVDFYLNLYYLTYEKSNAGFDFGLGELPIREKKSGGCYVATCIYGSYDCPEVWTLRRYRDYTLSQTWAGRMFIKTYYATSPTIVKLFGQTKFFKNFFTPRLNKMVSKLNQAGVENTPYNDMNW